MLPSANGYRPPPPGWWATIWPPLLGMAVVAGIVLLWLIFQALRSIDATLQTFRALMGQ